MCEDLEQRLIDLETKAAHQESALDELNQLVYRQAQTIERLEKDLTQIARRLREVAQEGDAGQRD